MSTDNFCVSFQTVVLVDTEFYSSSPKDRKTRKMVISPILDSEVLSSSPPTLLKVFCLLNLGIHLF